MQPGKKRKIWHLFAGIGFFAAATAVVMLLWNAIIPGVIGWGSISFLQAAGLFLLTRILFGGHGPGHWGGWHGRRGFQDPKEHARMQEEMKCMSWNEKREYIRRRMCEMHEGDDHHGKRPTEPSAGDEQHGA